MVEIPGAISSVICPNPFKDDKIASKLTPDGSFSARRSWDFTRKDWYNWGPLKCSQATDIASLHGLRFTTVFPLR